MNVQQLIEKLQKLPPETEVWVDASMDYEDHQPATTIVKGNGRHGMCGGSFEKNNRKFTAIEIK